MEKLEQNLEISDGELRVMKVLWEYPGSPTKVIAFDLYQKYDWAPGTTYTVLARCVKKGFATKDEKGCWSPAITKSEARDLRMQPVADELYGGSTLEMTCAFVREANFSFSDLEVLKQIVEQLQQES